MKKLLVVLALVSTPVWAICPVDGDVRLRNLAEKEFTQAVEEFQNANPVRACEHLKLSRSYIKQTDNKIAEEYLVILYDKMCEAQR